MPLWIKHFGDCHTILVWSNFKPKLCNFKPKLYTTQKRLEVTSCPNCSLYKTIFTSFKALLYTCKAPWTNFNTLLYTCKIPLNKLQCLFAHVQKLHANVQSPFVHDAKSYCLSGNHNDSCYYPKSVIRLLCANKLSFCHLPFRFSVAMEPHCALKT